METLRGFLDHQRDTLLRKVARLCDDQLRVRHPPSTLTLAALVKHLACVEDNWTSRVLLGDAELEPWTLADWNADRDGDITSPAHDTGAQLLAQYAESRSRSDGILAELAASSSGLESLSERPDRRTGQPFSLQWVIVRPIKKYARHLGHADLIRDAIDGETGD